MTVIKKDEKTGKYFFVLDTGKEPMTGKRKQLKRRGFDLKHEAKLALAKLQIEVSEAKELSVVKLPFSKYLAQWFEAKKIKLKPSTIQNYEEQIRYNIVPYIGVVQMGEFSEQIIQTYIQTLHKERKLSPATIRAAYGIVAEVLYKASQKGILNKSMLDDISLLRMPKKLRVWTADEMILFLDAPQRVLILTRHFIGFSISTQTGMRMGEVLGLRWSDIDFEGKRIFIRQTLSKIEEDSVYGFVNEGKTNAALRVVFVPDALLSSLKSAS